MSIVKNKRPKFLDWLIKGEGTIREPWPTPKEIVNLEHNKSTAKKVEQALKKAVQESNKSYQNSKS